MQPRGEQRRAGWGGDTTILASLQHSWRREKYEKCVGPLGADRSTGLGEEIGIFRVRMPPQKDQRSEHI
jgi:hypothetical protein